MIHVHVYVRYMYMYILMTDYVKYNINKIMVYALGGSPVSTSLVYCYD